MLAAYLSFSFARCRRTVRRSRRCGSSRGSSHGSETLTQRESKRQRYVRHHPTSPHACDGESLRHATFPNAGACERPFSAGISPVMKAFTVRALDESTWPAFAELVEWNNGVLAVAGAWGSTLRGWVRKPLRNSIVSGSWSVCGQERPMPRSVRRRRLRGLVSVRRSERIAKDQELRRVREGPHDRDRLANRLQLRRQRAPTPRSRDGRTRRGPRPHRRARRRHGRGLSGGRSLGSCRLPVQRCSFDL